MTPADAAAASLRRQALACASGGLLLALALASPGWLIGESLAAEMRRSGIAAVPLAALLIFTGGLIGAWFVARSRAAATTDPRHAASPGRAARLPQALAVPAFCLPAAYVAWALRPLITAPAVSPDIGFTLGTLAVALAFLLLIAERHLASAHDAVLPEAPALRALAFLATAACFAIGVLELAATAGLPYTGQIGDALAMFLALVALELALRAASRIFLPAPPPHAARGAATSLIARALTAGARTPGAIGVPGRLTLGIDFSRSWALRYLRQAALPMVAFLAVLAWGLTGVVLVPLDGRAVYERFGAPVAVLHPGLHAILPWPLGAARPVEFGPVHAIGLSDAATAFADTAGPEDAAPASADRLWEQAHPAEISLLVASAANQRQSFQSVSADMRILYRVGLSDTDALHGAYRVAEPEAFVRAAAGRVVAAYFAARSLDDVLGANREAMAETLRTRLQLALDEAGSGLNAVAVVIEAIHPPAGAADAYHNVRAAEIAARASVAVEHGAAAAIYAQSRQFAFDQTSNARAAAAEAVDGARTQQIRFTADQLAAKAGGQSFLLERYFAALSASLSKAPKTIIDHRLNWPEAPVLDLRPFSAAATAGAGKEE